MHAGADLPVHHAPALYRHLSAAGVEVVPATFVTEIRPESVACEARFGGRRFEIAPVATVVLAMGNVAETGLAADLERTSAETLLVGDAVAPRQVEHAILDGERAGWLL
jgi:hypothetical protein